MSQHNNPSTISDGVVFAYDQANSKSYKGPAIKNFLTGISPSSISDNGTTYRFFSGTEQVYIPEVGTVTSAYVDMYNDYNGGSNNCCPSPYSYGSIGSITGNTQYTYGILYKSYNRYTNPNWMYHYEYGPSGYITEYGVHMVGGYSGQETHLGDGWYWSRAVFTTHPNCTSLYTGSWMYQYATWNRFYVAKVALLQGNWLDLHPKYWPDVNTTRTNTENIKSLTDSTATITATSLTYASDGTFSFNAASSNYIDSGYDLSWNNTNSASIDFWCRPTTTSQNVGIIGKGSDWEWQVRQNGDAVQFIYWDTGGSHNNGPIPIISSTFAANVWKHIAVVWSHTANQLYIYANGVLISTSNWTNAAINANKSNTVKIGGLIYDWAGGGSYWSGSIAAVKLYSIALSPAEIQQNFNALRGRYGI